MSKLTDATEALHHLGNVLYMLAELHPDEQTKAYVKALPYYNAQFPDAKIMPEEGYSSRIVITGPLDQGLAAIREHEAQAVDVTQLRKRIMAAISSYGTGSQDKGSIEARADGVMIVLQEYVLPLLRTPQSQASAPCSHTHGIITLLTNAKSHPQEDGWSIVPNWALNLVADSIKGDARGGEE